MSKSKQYVRNMVMFSPLGNRFYFVPKAEVLNDDNPQRARLRVVGRKVDVTASMQPYVLKKYRANHD